MRYTATGSGDGNIFVIEILQTCCQNRNLGNFDVFCMYKNCEKCAN